MKRSLSLLSFCPILLAIALLTAEGHIVSVAAQSLSSEQPSVSVKKDRDPDARSPLPPEGKYNTPNLKDIKGSFRSQSGRPSPAAPLYRRYPPEEVIVAEVGNYFVLSRLELERMAATEALANARMQGVNPNDRDEIVQREWERLQQETEDSVLREWAFSKTIVMEARKAGLSVTPEETEAKLAELTREGIGANAAETVQKYNKAIGIDQDKLREQIADALLMDKYILQKVHQRFSEKVLRDIYDKSPSRYMTPMKIHLWQIYRKIDPKVIRKGSKEYSDLREEFYDIAKKAAKSDGKNFEELARQFSDDPMTKENGGDMGWVEASVPLPEEITKAINKMQVGKVSHMVEAPSGFHVFRVTEIEASKGTTYDESARQKVIDECVFEFKQQMIDTVLRTASEKVRLNASGLRLRNGTYISTSHPGQAAAASAPVAPAETGPAVQIVATPTGSLVTSPSHATVGAISIPVSPSGQVSPVGQTLPPATQVLSTGLAPVAVQATPIVQTPVAAVPGAPQAAPPAQPLPAGQSVITGQPSVAVQVTPSVQVPAAGQIIPTAAQAAPAVQTQPVAPSALPAAQNQPVTESLGAPVAAPTPLIIPVVPAAPAATVPVQVVPAPSGQATPATQVPIVPPTSATPVAAPASTPVSGPILITPSGIMNLSSKSLPATTPAAVPATTPAAMTGSASAIAGAQVGPMTPVAPAPAPATNPISTPVAAPAPVAP